MGRKTGSGKGVQVSKRYRVTNLRFLADKIGPKNMRDLKNSPFGHLFGIHPLKFQGQLHVMLCNVLRGSSKTRSCLEFEIGGCLVEFGPADFALMSGLKMGGSTYAPEKSEFHQCVFKGSSSINFHEIEDRFVHECERDYDSDVALKLAYLYIVYGTLLQDRRRESSVSIKYMHLIDDLDSFKSFPWGRVSYEILLRETFQTKEYIDALDVVAKNRSCEATGFADILQVWAYEICAHVASYCANPKDPLIEHPARLLKWTSSRMKSSYDEIKKLFLPSCGYKPEAIEVKEAESRMLIELGVTVDMRVATPGPIIRNHREKKRKAVDGENGNVGRSSGRLRKKANIQSKNSEEKLPAENAEAILSTVKTLLADGVKVFRSDLEAFEGRVMVGFKKLGARLERLERYSTRTSGEFGDNPSEKYAKGDADVVDKSKKVEDKEKDVEEGRDIEEEEDDEEDSEEGRDVEQEKDIDEKTKYDDEEVKNDDGEDKAGLELIPYASKCIDDEELGSDQFPVDEGVLISKDMRPSSSNPLCQGESPLTSDASLDTVVKMVTRSARAKAVELLQYVTDKPVKQFDVSERNWKAAKSVLFDEWMRMPATKTRSRDKSQSLLLPATVLRWGDKQWVGTLLKWTGWLDNHHINTLMNLVAYEFDIDSRIRNWTVLDMPTTNSLMSEDFRLESIEPYVLGLEPKISLLPWECAHSIFGCCLVGGDHWVLYQISFSFQKVVLYDTLKMDGSTLTPYVLALARNVPKVLKEYRVWDHVSHKSPEPLKDNWDIVLCESAPRQIGTANCGILCMKMLECITRDIPLSTIDVDRCAIYRRSYCVKLHKYSVDHQESDEGC